PCTPRRFGIQFAPTLAHGAPRRNECTLEQVVPTPNIWTTEADIVHFPAPAIVDAVSRMHRLPPYRKKLDGFPFCRTLSMGSGPVRFSSKSAIHGQSAAGLG